MWKARSHRGALQEEEVVPADWTTEAPIHILQSDRGVATTAIKACQSRLWQQGWNVHEYASYIYPEWVLPSLIVALRVQHGNNALKAPLWDLRIGGASPSIFRLERELRPQCLRRMSSNAESATVTKESATTVTRVPTPALSVRPIKSISVSKHKLE